MASYKRNADLNRDALFGPSPGGGASRSKNRTTNSATQPNQQQQHPPVSSSLDTARASNIALTTKGTTVSATGPRRTNHVSRTLTGAAKVEKMKEAEKYRKKAKEALSKTLFSSPDPIAGAMFYNRAAEAYKLCGENRLERLHRIASGDCQLGHGAFSTAAQEYVRAAELSEISDETPGRKRAECNKLYSDAAKAWKEAGEMGRSGECMLKSAFSLLIGTGDNEDEDIVIGGKRLLSMNNQVKDAIETAIESHVPDPLNRYKHFRQTGLSAFVDPDKDEQTEGENAVMDEETLMEMCRSHMVTKSYTNETLFQAVVKFVEYGEYKSALYAAGAVTAILEESGFATISLSRAYCVETILALAMGDVITADKYFLEVHLQKNSYLTSRECKLAEDLIRAVKMRDVDDLEMARDPNGENKAALANLDSSIRLLVATLRISGAAKKAAKPVPKPTHVPSLTTAPPPSLSVGTAEAETPQTTGNNVHDELDNLMNDMGLGDDEDNDDDFDDDELDLR